MNFQANGFIKIMYIELIFSLYNIPPKSRIAQLSRAFESYSLFISDLSTREHVCCDNEGFCTTPELKTSSALYLDPSVTLKQLRIAYCIKYSII